MNTLKSNRIIHCFILAVLLFSNKNIAFGQTHIVPISATTTAGEFGGSTGITNIFNEATAFSDPLTDVLANICSVGIPIPYISGSGITTGTLTVGIPTSSIDALHIWNGWSTACELNHSLNNITLEFFSGGLSVGSEVLTVPMPDGSGFGFVVPFASTYSGIDEVTIVVNSLHGGNEIGIIELGFRAGISCDDLTTTVSSDEICLGEEITLRATSINGGTITWDGGIVDGVPFEPLTAGIHTFNATSDNVDDCSFSVDITVHDLPIVTASADNTAICIGDDVTLTGGGADAYVWDMGVVDGVAFAPAATATYTVTGTDINGCVNTDDVLVDVIALPIIDAGLDIAVCDGEPVILNGAGAGVGGTYAWDGGITDGTAFTPVATNLYTVTGTDANGCENTDDVTVTVNPLPVIDAGPNEAICIGESYTLAGTGFDISDVIVWDRGVINGIPFDPTTTETYTFTVTTAEGCMSTDNVTITVNPLPVVDFSADDTVGCDPFTVQFTSATSGESLYSWSFGDGDAAVGASVLHTYNGVGLYDVKLTVTSTDGCVDSDNYNDYINVIPQPVAHFTFMPEDESEFNYSYIFHNESTDATNYSWSFGDGATLDGEEHPTHTYPQTANGNYHITLIATNDIGCESIFEDNISIKKELIFFIPNAFTPDGDTFNETFKPIFTLGLDVYDYHMTIFNRWGEKVFESFNASKGWDGSYGNQGIVDDGSYVWVIEFGEVMSDKKHIERGTVTILQ